MNIYLLGDDAFVDIGKDQMLCVGKKVQVDRANQAELAQLIFEALAVAEFHSIEKSPKTLH